MREYWTVYDEQIDECNRQVTQINILIEIEKWKDISERMREKNIRRLSNELKQSRKHLKKYLKLKREAI